MKIVATLLLSLGLSLSAFSYSPETTTGSINEQIRKEIQYPRQALKYNAQGVVWIEFTIGAQGDVHNIKPLTNHGNGLEEEVVRVIQKLNGAVLAAPGEYRIPVKFEIR